MYHIYIHIQYIFKDTIFVSGDTFLLPNKTFMMMGGIQAYDLHSVTFQIGRTLDPYYSPEEIRIKH